MGGPPWRDTGLNMLQKKMECTGKLGRESWDGWMDVSLENDDAG